MTPNEAKLFEKAIYNKDHLKNDIIIVERLHEITRQINGFYIYSKNTLGKLQSSFIHVDVIVLTKAMGFNCAVHVDEDNYCYVTVS